MTDIANRDQYDAWNGDSGRRWVSDPDRRDRLIAPVIDLLLDAARLATGDAVLDVGCGCGATTLAAARAVAPGEVVGLDISGPMLDVARTRLAETGLSNVTFEQGDTQVHPLSPESFDVVMSRFGTMFFADGEAAFTNVRRALKRGGRLALATWQPLEANPWLTVPGQAVLGPGPLPGLGPGPGMFGQSDPAAIETTLRAAGFDDVTVTPVTVTLDLGDGPADAAAHVGDSGVGRAMLEALPEGDRAAALANIEAALAEHVVDGSVRLDGGVLITRARAG